MDRSKYLHIDNNEYENNELTYNEYYGVALLSELVAEALYKKDDVKAAIRCFARLLNLQLDRLEIEHNALRRYPLDLDKIKREEVQCQIA